jgi:nucleoside-diphosphate-sugar epimerase
MKALVTGATGFIGSHLCEELIRRGYRVTCLSRETSSHTWIENLNVTHIRGDCTDRESLLRNSDEFDYVFHLAGLTKACSPDAFYSVNARGTANLVRTVAERNPSVKRFIYVSSLAAIGPSRNGAPVLEDTPPAPVSHYGKSKLEGEMAVLKFRDDLPVTILRPPAVYGPRDRDMLVLFQMIKKGFFFDLGKCYYSLLYVDDLIQGILLSAEREQAVGKTFFLCDGNIYTGDEIANEISSVLQVRARPVKVPKFAMSFFAAVSEKLNKRGIINRDRIEDFKHTHWICEADKACKELGFSPKVLMKEGIRWTADWYRKQRWL